MSDLAGERLSPLMAIVRPIWAVIATAVFTGIICAILFVGSSIFEPGPRSVGGLFEFGSFVAFFGSLFAVLPAIAMAIVEIPKARHLSSRQSGGLGLQCGGSILFAVSLVVIGFAIQQLLNPSPVSANPDYLDVVLALIGAFAIGGLVSSLSWWRLVIIPTRRARFGAPGASNG